LNKDNMKKLILIMFVIFILSGCGATQKMAKSYNDLVNQIPSNEFEKFEYHRSGIYSSAHIIAEDAAKVNGLLMIDKFYMQLNYGPENLTISMEGYVRDVENENNSK